MKNILLADNRDDLLATLEPILKHWGYRVISTLQADQVMTFLKESTPCLLIVGEGILADPKLGLDKKTINDINTGKLPFVALKDESVKNAEVSSDETLEVPLELFELFSFIQTRVEKHPRQNLRLRVRLPGMYSIEKDEFILADVLSLSMQGLFFKAAARVKQGDKITVVFPLLGQCREIEVTATVLYVIQPDANNNFFQGFGVGFDEIPEGLKEHLQLFIRERFLKEVSSRNDGVGDFASEQLKE